MTPGKWRGIQDMAGKCANGSRGRGSTAVNARPLNRVSRATHGAELHGRCRGEVLRARPHPTVLPKDNPLNTVCLQ